MKSFKEWLFKKSKPKPEKKLEPEIVMCPFCKKMTAEKEPVSIYPSVTTCKNCKKWWYNA